MSCNWFGSVFIVNFDISKMFMGTVIVTVCLASKVLFRLEMKGHVLNHMHSHLNVPG